MAGAADLDFLGEGLADTAAAPDDPNDAPNPNNPDGISNNELSARNLRANQINNINKDEYNKLGPVETDTDIIGYTTDSNGNRVTIRRGTDAENSDYAAKLGYVSPDLSGQPVYSQTNPDPLANAGDMGGNAPPPKLPSADQAINGNTPPPPQAAAPVDAAPVVDRSHIDPLLNQLSGTISQLQSLAGDNTGLSAALAQLASASANARSTALSLAQSGDRRNRAGDLRKAESMVVGGEQQAARDAALLRANEEDSDRRFRLDALTKAGDLGINTAALETDISKADLGAASSYINNQFQQAGINAQISAQMAQSYLGFARDMEALKFQYAQLSSQEQQALVSAELQKYGIDKDVQLQQWVTKQNNKPDWLGFTGGLLGAGIGAGATLGAASIKAAATIPAVTSDRRAKTSIEDTPETELDDLLTSIKSQTYRYKDEAKHGEGDNLGVMAQDLQKSKLGATMVSKGEDGTLQVDTGKAALAALSGLARVYDKLKDLEGAL